MRIRLLIEESSSSLKYMMSPSIMLERGMSEIEDNKLPIPLVNYIQLIRTRKSPYYDIVHFLMKEMETHYHVSGRESDVVYTINPRILHGEIEKRVQDERLTTVNVCRTILALLYGSRLSEEEDFYVTTTSSGRRNYHVKVNMRTLNTMQKFL